MNSGVALGWRIAALQSDPGTDLPRWNQDREVVLALKSVRVIAQCCRPEIDGTSYILDAKHDGSKSQHLRSLAALPLSSLQISCCFSSYIDYANDISQPVAKETHAYPLYKPNRKRLGGRLSP